MRKYLVTIFLTAYAFSFAQNKQDLGKYYSAKEELAIVKVMQSQMDAWNKGDVEGYMQGYWNSDSLRMVTKAGIQYGWKLTLEMYKKGLPTKELMGTLHLKAEKLDFLNKDTALMIGRWGVEAKEKTGGHYIQLWKKIKGKWVITTDYTS